MKKLFVLVGVVLLVLACAGTYFTPDTQVGPVCEDTNTPEITENPPTEEVTPTEENPPVETVVNSPTPEITVTSIIITFIPPRPPRPHTLVPPEQDEDEDTQVYIAPVTGGERSHVEPEHILMFVVGLLMVYVGVRYGIFGNHK